MHGQYIRNIDRQLISEEDTFHWLSKGDLKAETESEIVAAQDQALQTKYYATKICDNGICHSVWVASGLQTGRHPYRLTNTIVS